jgi:hypothetical protein
MRISELLDWLEASIPLWEEVALSDAPIDPHSLDLQKEYHKLNVKFFDGKLGMYPMKWNRRKGSGGLVKFRLEGGQIRRRIGRERGDRLQQREGARIVIRYIEISTYYTSTIIGFIATLVHEMIHVFLLEQNIDDGHGRLFKAQMNRINAMNPGFEVKIREDATDFIPVKVAKTGKGERRGVIIFDNRSIIPFGPKHFSDSLFELMGFPAAWLEKHEFEWYWSDAPGLISYPAKQKIGRRFGVYPVDADLIKEVRRGEKIAEMKGGQPQTLMPKYFQGQAITGIERIGRDILRFKYK